MFQQERELERLQARKAELIARSGQQRLQIQTEVARLKPFLSAVERGSQWVNQAIPWVNRTLPLVRSWLTPSEPGTGFLGKAQRYVGFVRSIASFATSWFSNRG